MYDNNSAPGLSVATALFFTWAFLTFCVRAWVKLRRSEGWGWDDSTITAALAFSLAHVISVFWAIHAGYGSFYDSLADSALSVSLKAIYASEFFYIISVGLTKVSVGLFIGQLTRDRRQVKVAYILAGVCSIWTLASIFIVAFRGDLQEPWTALNGSSIMFVRWIIIEVIGLVLELALWGLSFHIIWNLSMPLAKRCTVLTIFGFRLLLVPMVAIRIRWLSAAENPQLNAPNTTTDIITEGVLEFAFISASVTCLKPFLKPFASSYVVNSMAASGSGFRSGSNTNSKDPYYSLSAVQSESDGVVIPKSENKLNASTTSGRRNVGKTFRPDQFDQEATISSSSRHSSADDDVEQMIIRKTETWSVRFEEGKTGPTENQLKPGHIPSTIKE